MNDDLHHLAGAYALDALPDDERAAFEAHYESCELCLQEVREFRETAGLLAGAEAEAPPPELRDATLRAIDTVRQDGPAVVDRTAEVVPLYRRPRILAAVAAVVAVIAGVVGVQILGDDETEDLFAAPDAIVTSLEGERGNLQVVWSPDRDELAIIGDGLVDLSDDQIYELWFLLDEGVARAVLFRTVDGEINEVFEVDDIDGGGFGVTIEPAGGSDQPTSEVIYVGEV